MPMKHSTGLAMSTSASELLARIEWILRNRELTQEQFCERAGFANRTQVSAVLHRLRNDPEYPSKMSLFTYQKMAKGGRVSLDWLLFGKGTPDQVKEEPADTQYPNLNKALEIEGARWAEHVIAAVLLMPWKSDRKVESWIAILDKVEGDMARYMKLSP